MRSELESPHYDHSLVLEMTLTERYFVTDEALALVPKGVDRDRFLIQLFDLHAASVYGERLFYNDANPQVGVEVLEVDPDA